MRTSGSRVLSAIFVFLLCCAASSWAQASAVAQGSGPCGAFSLTPDNTLAFDVAVIRPGDPSRDRVLFKANDYGKWEVEGVTLSTLIEEAYGVDSYQVEGIPPGLRQKRFDIRAKTLAAPGGGPVPRVDPNEAKRLQTLLADQFGVRLHCRVGEHKTAVLYRDPKHAAPPVSTLAVKDGRWREGHGSVTGKGVSFQVVVHEAGWALQEKVEDDTGLQGSYDFDLKWTPPGETSDDPDAKTFEQALYEAFGVRVKHEMRPLAVLVVDQAHMPQLEDGTQVSGRF
ncbi:TIGR03435 family protein [Silvibacterium dinghuense]|nr:TIGR03435 family protein [Silvibacterium dinghuense]